jgi:hypothetical protein
VVIDLVDGGNLERVIAVRVMCYKQVELERMRGFVCPVRDGMLDVHDLVVEIVLSSLHWGMVYRMVVPPLFPWNDGLPLVPSRLYLELCDILIHVSENLRLQ